MKSQDFHLSLYDSGPLFLNPAMTGVVDATARIHAQYRNQWSSVAYKPFTTAMISADMPRDKWGYGIQIMNMRAGIGNYNAFQALVSAGYALPIDKEKVHNITFGLQAGITQKSIRDDKFSFDEQYNTKNGGYFDETYSNNENFTRQSQILPQLNAGFMYFYTKQQSWVNPFIGVSAFNLTKPRPRRSSRKHRPRPPAGDSDLPVAVRRSPGQTGRQRANRGDPCGALPGSTRRFRDGGSRRPDHR